MVSLGSEPTPYLVPYRYMNRKKTLEIMHSGNGRHKIIFIYSPLKQRGSLKAYQ